MQKNKVIKECLEASLLSVFIPDWEFETLIGVKPEEVKELLLSKEGFDLNDENTKFIVRNIIINLLGYPHNVEGEEWKSYFSFSQKELEHFFENELNTDS